jgi:hypothetical protein
VAAAAVEGRLVTGPAVIPLGGGQVLLRGPAVVDAWRLARSAAEQVSQRDGIVLPPRLRELLAALEQEAAQVVDSVAGNAEFREAASVSALSTDDRITTVEAAAMLQCTPRTVRNHAADLSGRQVAGRWVFSRAAVAAQLAEEMSA